MGKASFKIFPESKLIIEKYSGIVSLSEYTRMRQEELSHPDFNLNYNVLGDLRQASIELGAENKDQTIAYVSEYLHAKHVKIGKMKCALLAIKPEQVVSSIFFSDYVKDFPIQVKIFTTGNVALDWLGVKNKKEILDELS